MKNLVTGSSGFIGSHLIETLLQAGHQVVALDRTAPHLTHPNLTPIIGDIRNPALLAQAVTAVNTIYHLASAHLDVSQPDSYYQEVNVQATHRLLTLAQDHGVTRFVHVSTNSVLGHIQQLPADEANPCHPTNIYETTKLAGERIALDHAQTSPMTIVVARPAWVYGSRCPRTIKLIRMVGKKRFLLFGNGSTWRHPLYIDDAITGLCLCATQPDINGEIFFLAGDRPVTIKDLIHEIAQLQGVNPPTLHIPMFVGEIAGISLQTLYKPLRKSPPFSRRSLDFFRKHNAYNTTKAQQKLGFYPQTSLRAGLQKTINQLKP